LSLSVAPPRALRLTSQSMNLATSRGPIDWSRVAFGK
jgi:hypothetical protein